MLIVLLPALSSTNNIHTYDKYVFVKRASIDDDVAESFLEYRLEDSFPMDHSSVNQKRKFQAPVIYNVFFRRARYRRKFR